MDTAGSVVRSLPDTDTPGTAGRTAGRGPASAAWEAPLAAFRGEPLVCRRADALPCAPEELARDILSRGEWEYWAGMRAVEKRRREWLLGRLVAKDAVGLLVQDYMGEPLTPAEIEIVPDAYGQPHAAGRWTERLGVRPALSISHSDGTAVALAALHSGRRVGIDLENLAQRREDFEAIAFSPDERQMLAAMPEALRPEWALRMWCAKESLAKALGRGFSAGIQAFHITAASLAGGEMQLELRDGALRQFPGLRGQRTIAYTAREMDFVFSTVVYQEGAIE